MRKSHLAILTAAALALGAFGAQASTNLLTNGSFETGDFTGWSTAGLNVVVTGAFSAYAGAEDGSWYTVFGNIGSDGTLSQTFSDTAGAPLSVSFWLNAVGDSPSDFSATFDGTTLYSATDPATRGWTQFTFNVLGTGSDTLLFAGRDDPSWLALDNVSVTSVPEPATWALMLTGFAGLGLALRRRAKTAAA
jgi:hypothetical protein